MAGMQKTKLCPFCREEINVLAQKCKYCHMDVGKPLESERTLTVDDIGRPIEHETVVTDTFIGAYNALKDNIEKERQEEKSRQEKRERIVRLSKRVFMVLLLIAGIGILERFGLGINIGSQLLRLLAPVSTRAQYQNYLENASQAVTQNNAESAVRYVRDALLIKPGDAEALNFFNNYVRPLVVQRVQSKITNGTLFEDFDSAHRTAQLALQINPSDQEMIQYQNDADSLRKDFDIQLNSFYDDERGVAAVVTVGARTLDKAETKSLRENDSTLTGFNVEDIDKDLGIVRLQQKGKTRRFTLTRSGLRYQI